MDDDCEKKSTKSVSFFSHNNQTPDVRGQISDENRKAEPVLASRPEAGPLRRPMKAGAVARPTSVICLLKSDT